MTSKIQREHLHNQIWKMANEVRGAVDGWDFKQFVLGMLFYRFICEHFVDYIEAGDPDIHYAQMADEDIDHEVRTEVIKEKGYFIYPSQLFTTVYEQSKNKSNEDDDLNTRLRAIFDAIEASAVGTASEQDVKGLFADFDTTSSRLGNSVPEKNRRLRAVMQGVAELDFGAFQDSQ